MRTWFFGRRSRAIGITLVLCAAAASASHSQPAAVPEVELKLFEKSEVDRSKGCSVALWQANRDPEKDKYAYVFIETMSGPNHSRQPARIKIGDKIVTLLRVATGGRNNGFNLFEYQLYKLPGDNEYVVLELRLGALAGEAVEVESGTMTIAMRGRQVFRAAVKGGAGCMTPAAAVPPDKPAQGSEGKTSRPGGGRTGEGRADNPDSLFHRYIVRPADVPRAFSEAVRKKYACDPDFMKSGVIAFQVSEEAAIWQVPCQRFAFQATAVYALVYIPDPAASPNFLGFQEPKGHPRSNEPGVLMSPEWDVKTRTVKSVSLGNARGECGVLERHRVTAEGQFELIEYREKKSCDGKSTKPEEFPLVFRAK